LACLLCSQSVVAAKVKLVIENYPPYMDKDDAQKGVVTDLVVKAFKQSGTKAKVQFGTWSEVEQQINEHRAVSFMWLKTKTRVKKWHFSEPMYLQKKRLLVNQNFSKPTEHLYQLSGIDVGITRGFGYGKKFDDYRHRLKLKENGSDYQTVQALLNKQVELAVVDPLVAVYLVNKYFSQNQRPSLRFIDGQYFDPITYYLVCSKDYGNCLNHIKKFNKGMNALAQQGLMKSLLKQAETF
jgi:polar amino acid transport system substrate-binding protein